MEWWRRKAGQDPNHKETGHADLDHTALARHDVNVVAPLSHHSHSKRKAGSSRALSARRNDKGLRVGGKAYRSRCHRQSVQNSLEISFRTKLTLKDCHSEPGAKPGEEPAVSYARARNPTTHHGQTPHPIRVLCG
jgi:hypothetical protein